MTFPLPEGYCRKVCRPVRDKPRLTGWREVMRMAKAAVKNGEGPCSVLSAAYQAVPELRYPERLYAESEALIDATIIVNDATEEILLDLAGLRGGRVFLPWRVIGLIYDIYTLVEGLNAMSDAQVALIATARSAANCLETRNANRSGVQ